ncbi:hypothetical protein Tco_1064871 [Tanacetum coccineum]
MVEEDALLAFQQECGDSLEAKYMVEDASSKKFLVSNFTNYKMTDSRPVLEQYNELLSILGKFTQHKMNMDEAIQVSCIIDKLPPFWKDFKHTDVQKIENNAKTVIFGYGRSEDQAWQARDLSQSLARVKMRLKGHVEIG